MRVLLLSTLQSDAHPTSTRRRGLEISCRWECTRKLAYAVPSEQDLRFWALKIVFNPIMGINSFKEFLKIGHIKCLLFSSWQI